MTARWAAALAACAALALSAAAAVQPGTEDVRAHYEKRELMIPMRDGVRLFTIVYTPRDTSRAYPFFLARTAYGIPPYGPDNYRAVLGPYRGLTDERYIFVYQDARGRFKSEGTFIHHVPLGAGAAGTDESTDTWDTVEWLVKHVPNNNGRVGQRGVSWGGWEVSMGMIDAHPAIRASSPQAPPQDQFLGDDHHSGGAFQLAYAFNWLSDNARDRAAPTDSAPPRFDFGTPDGYDFFLRLGAAANARRYFGDQVPTWNDYMRHGTYDEYWQARNVPRSLERITHPVLVVAGWFDAEDFHGPFRMFRALEAKNPGNQATLVVGPWTHGAWATAPGDAIGPIAFGSKTGEYFRNEIEQPFFRHHLKDAGPLALPKAVVFETGANAWHRLDRWPPAEAVPTKLYLGTNGTLSFDPPAPARVGFDTYVSDPAKPVPYTAEITTRENPLFVIEDQRFAARRPDVLVYQTGTLPADVTVAGEIAVELFASTTGTDSDWVVKLIDVFPERAPDPLPNPWRARMGGYQMLLAGEILRGKFRRSLSRPEPMVPGAVTRLAFPLGDRYHTFLAGHRIMVQVQSSWFPMFDRNPQRFVDIYHAREGDYQPATQRVWRTPRAPSHLVLPVLPAPAGAR